MKITIDKNYRYFGTMDELDQSIYDFKKYTWKDEFIYSKPLDFSKYKVNATISVGTVYILGGLGPSINILMNLSNISEHEQRVNIQTRIRPEYLLTSVFFLVFIFAPSELEYATRIKAIGIWLISLLGLYFIYRVQELLLIDKVVKLLKLKEEKL